MAKKPNNTKETNKSKTMQPAEYEQLILDHVNHFPSGLTIADISKNLGISRITISKYISVLEAKEKVLSKSIGAYTLYLPLERTFIPWTLVNSYYQGLLKGLSEEFPEDKEEAFKRIGLNMNKFITFPLGSDFPEEVLKPEKGSYRKLLEYYAKSHETMDLIFGGSIEIEVDINDEGNEAKYSFKNIKLLKENKDFILHFYIMCGMIERTLEDSIDKKVNCKIEKIYDNNVELSIQIS